MKFPVVLVLLMRPKPMPAVVAWFVEYNAQEMYQTAVNEAELRYDLAIMLAGKRRSALEGHMIRRFKQGFGERVLPFESHPCICRNRS